jgi:hypothetical protein
MSVKNTENIGIAATTIYSATPPKIDRIGCTTSIGGRPNEVDPERPAKGNADGTVETKGPKDDRNVVTEITGVDIKAKTGPRTVTAADPTL